MMVMSWFRRAPFHHLRFHLYLHSGRGFFGIIVLNVLFILIVTWSQQFLLLLPSRPLLLLYYLYYYSYYYVYYFYYSYAYSYSYYYDCYYYWATLGCENTPRKLQCPQILRLTRKGSKGDTPPSPMVFLRHFLSVFCLFNRHDFKSGNSEVF